MRIALFFLLTISLAGSGCVMRSTFDQKAAEAASTQQTLAGLQEKHEQLTEKHRSLRQEKNSLNGQLADVLTEKSDLQQDILRARADRDRMEKLYSSKNAEAGKTIADMRLTIDTLEEQNRDQLRQLEEERLARQEQVAELTGTYNQLVGKLEQEIERGEVTISELEGKLTVNLVERIIFDSGQAEIKPAGLAVLQRVGDILKETRDKAILVEGHTDNVPISPRLRQKFPSNWELSAARAINVVRFLQEQVGIAGGMLQASGLGEFQPIADNSTKEGKAQNRRIQIILVPNEKQQPSF